LTPWCWFCPVFHHGPLFFFVSEILQETLNRSDSFLISSYKDVRLQNFKIYSETFCKFISSGCS
jgi:hypothetical protein